MLTISGAPTLAAINLEDMRTFRALACRSSPYFAFLLAMLGEVSNSSSPLLLSGCCRSFLPIPTNRTLICSWMCLRTEIMLAAGLNAPSRDPISQNTLDKYNGEPGNTRKAVSTSNLHVCVDNVCGRKFVHAWFSKYV